MRSLSSDENIAEEVVQEAFFKALKSINSFDGSTDIRAWLFIIAKNIYFSYYKRSKKNIGYDFLEETTDTGVTITEQLLNEEDAFMIHQFLHTMEEPYKEVFFLRVFGELHFEKIGKLFAKSSE